MTKRTGTKRAETAPNFAPLRDRILIKQDVAGDEARPGSVILAADISKERPQTGVVIAVGEGKPAPSDPTRIIPPAVKVGDRVYFTKFAAKVVFLPRAGDGALEEYGVLKEDDVLGVERL